MKQKTVRDTYVDLLVGRIKSLEAEIASRPTDAQIKDVQRHVRDIEAKYRASLARSRILTKSLREAELSLLQKGQS